MMTAGQYTELIDFLSDKFGRIDQRFDALEGRLGTLEGRVGSLEGRFDALEGRFDALEGRFDALEIRLTRVEIGLEALRHDVQLLAEASTATNEKLDRYHLDHEVRIKALEVHWFEA